MPLAFIAVTVFGYQGPVALFKSIDEFSFIKPGRVFFKLLDEVSLCFSFERLD
jgi:hypothetical protein